MSKATSMQEPRLKLTRIFDAPRELVFKVWTEPRHVLHWWGPKDFTAPFCTIDLRVGGFFHYCMRSPDGRDFWSKGVFREIVVPEKLVTSMWFSDKDGNFLKPTDYGIGSDFPTEMHDKITFDVHKGNKTKFALHRDTPISISKRYMEDQGWGQSLDKFAGELVRASK